MPRKQIWKEKAEGYSSIPVGQFKLSNLKSLNSSPVFAGVV